jgi:hypothetical protein
MDEEFKIIFEKFSRTIDELTEAKSAMAKILGKITEVGDIASRTTAAADKVIARLSECETSQEVVTATLATFTQKIEGAITYERELGEQIALLNKNFQGVINLSKQLSDGLSSIRQTEIATNKTIIEMELRLNGRISQLENIVGKVVHSVISEENPVVTETDKMTEKTGASLANAVTKSEYSVDRPWTTRGPSDK